MSARALTLKATLLLGLVLPTASAMAQSADNLFAKKNITIYIGNTAGGSYDLYGRMVARFLGKHLPGQPTVVAPNSTSYVPASAAATLGNSSRLR